MVLATSIASTSISPTLVSIAKMSLVRPPPSNPSSLTSFDSPDNSTTTTTTVLTPSQQLKTKAMQPQQSHDHLHHLLLQQQQQQQLFNRAKVENHLLSLTPAFVTSISSCQEDQENSTPSPSLSSLHHVSNRRVLRDITQALNRRSGLNPSTLALIHARSSRIIHHQHHHQQRNQQKQQHDGIAGGKAGLLRKKVVGYQHRKKMVPRRGAISLTAEEAMEISRELSQLTASQGSFSSMLAVAEEEDLQGRQEEKLYVAQKEGEEEKKKNAIPMQIAAGQATNCGSQMEIFPLDKNLFLVTRGDGHTLGCLARGSARRCGCATGTTSAALTAL